MTTRIKNTISYSTSEIAELIRVHPRTVQQWYKQGLPKIDSKRPFWVLGSDLKAFLEAKKRSRKHKCRKDEIYCMKCRCPRIPVGRSVSIIVYNPRQASIKGVCDVCGNEIYRLISIKNISNLGGIFKIHTIHHRNLLESDDPNINTDNGGE